MDSLDEANRLFAECARAPRRWNGKPPAKPREPQPSEILDRMPPADVEAEQCLIGSLMIRPELLGEVEQVVSPGHFHSEAHGIIYEFIRSGKTGDVVLLRHMLKKAKKLEDIGGDAYLMECGMAVPIAANAVQYALIVREKFLLRSLLQVATQMLKQTYADEADPLAIAAEAARGLERIVHDTKATYEPF